MRDKLEQLVRSSELREHLQEEFITLRGGRPVLAVKASARRSVPGIVHDASDSGQTLFVEPFDVVELSNRQSEATSAEREEVERILRELSAGVGEARRRARRARRGDGSDRPGDRARRRSRGGWNGAPVEVSDEVRLRGARHPLLDAELAVPIDLELGDLRALVISGPNTGGKTVALKTLGLAALLHQSGLRPPAETAALPVFDEVLADIGDRQSIEMSLSTFSGHVANIVAILDAAGGAVAGAAGRARLGHRPGRGLRARAGARRAARRAGAADARDDALPGAEGVGERDRGRRERGDGLRPRHACAALPGRARPAGHVARAPDRRAAGAGRRRRRGRARARQPERLRIQELLAEAEAAERAAVDERDAAERERAEAERLAAGVREREEELESEIAAVRASAGAERERAAAEAQRDLAAAREELAALRAEIRRRAARA